MSVSVQPTHTAKPDLAEHGHYTKKQVLNLAQREGVSEEDLDWVSYSLNPFKDEEQSPMLPPIGGTSPMLPFKTPAVLNFTRPASLSNTPWGVAVLFTNLTKATPMYRTTRNNARVATVPPGSQRMFGRVNWEYFDDSVSNPVVFDEVVPVNGDRLGRWDASPPNIVSGFAYSALAAKIVDVSPVISEAGQWDCIHAECGLEKTDYFYGDSGTAIQLGTVQSKMWPTIINAMPTNLTYNIQQKGDGILASQRFEYFPKVPAHEYSGDIRVSADTSCWITIPTENSQAVCRDGGSYMLLVFRGGSESTKFKMQLEGMGYQQLPYGNSLNTLCLKPPCYSAEAFELLYSVYHWLKASWPSYFNDTGWADEQVDNILGFVLDGGYDLVSGLLPSGLKRVADLLYPKLKSMLVSTEPATVGRQVEVVKEVTTKPTKNKKVRVVTERTTKALARRKARNR